MNIILTGFMGTGKSEVGQVLAKELGWPFFDIDKLIEEETGFKISEIFAKKGEPFFRKLETETIKLITLNDKAIIACGGGAVLKEENMDALEKNGIVVCLTATPEKIYERVKEEEHRPLLDVKDPLSKIKELFDSRRNYYKRCSFSVDTTDLSPSQVAEKILENPSVIKSI